MLDKNTAHIFKKKDESIQSSETSRKMRLQKALKSNMNRRREQKKSGTVAQHCVEIDNKN